MQSDVSKLKIKADAGDSDAAFAIFNAYEEFKTDEVVAWDVALHYLSLAADRENPDAMLAMGSLLIAGIKSDKDVEKGMALLRRAKDLGNKDVDNVVTELDVELEETHGDNIKFDIDKFDADNMAEPRDVDNPNKADDDDENKAVIKPEKTEEKNKKTSPGKPDATLTADQLMRMIKTKLSQLENSEAMSAAHHFDILKIVIDDSDNIKELQAVYDALNKPAYVETLRGQSHPIIGWNSKQGIFYLDTSGREDAESDQAPLPKRSYQRGEVRNLIFAVFITIVVLIIFLNLLYAVRPL